MRARLLRKIAIAALGTTVLLTVIFAPSRPKLQQIVDRSFCGGDFADRPPDLQIAACTVIIQSPIETQISKANAFHNRATAFAVKAYFDQAIADYSQAIQLNPSNIGLAYEGRCYAYFGKGNFDQAIDDCSRAVQLNPSFAQAYSDRGTGPFDRRELGGLVPFRAISAEPKTVNLNAPDSRSRHDIAP
jgi:tetratricopeptide (TPR) repeat protein